MGINLPIKYLIFVTYTYNQLPCQLCWPAKSDIKVFYLLNIYNTCFTLNYFRLWEYKTSLSEWYDLCLRVRVDSLALCRKTLMWSGSLLVLNSGCRISMRDGRCLFRITWCPPRNPSTTWSSESSPALYDCVRAKVICITTSWRWACSIHGRR